MHPQKIAPEHLHLQMSGVGVGKGLVRGYRKSNFADREASSGKYNTCETWALRVV